MSQETLGYTELEWTCGACGTRNRGTTRICASCGAAMSDDAKFDLPAQQQLLTSEEEIAKAKHGPDFTCAYCGARNPAGANSCSQCGADFSEAAVRQSGDVLGAFASEASPQVNCPHCGEPNSSAAFKCRACGASLGRVAGPAPARPRSGRTGLKILIGLVALLLMAGLGTLATLMIRTTDVVAVVQQVGWERGIDILEERPVTREIWEDEIPAGAVKGNCVDKTRRTQSSPAPNSIKVCGTPYTVNQGNGTGKVVQDCEYQIQDSWCKYTQDEWTVIAEEKTKGSDFEPRWPSVRLRSDQREGSRHERYQVTFGADDKQYNYSPKNADEYGRFTIESRWTLKVNGLGGVNSVAPAQ